MRLKTILRSLLRYRLNSSIIIISLAIGIACMNLIGIFLIKEFNADSFHKNKERIYALQADDPWGEGQKMYYIRDGAAEYMKDNFSEVEDYCRILNASPSKVRANNHDYFDDKLTIAVSSNFFTFFSFPLISGSPEHVLETHNDLVISEKLALKYFGTTNPVGQKIVFPNGNEEMDMIVKGVFRKPKESTQLNFEMVRLIGEESSRCYLLVKENTNITQLEEKFVRNKDNIPIVHDGTPGTHYLNGLQAAYFDTTRGQTIENSRDKTDLFIALGIALMILGVALFNYLGLINNRLMEKNRENAIRRVNGGSKMNLISGFMQETFILVGLSFLLSIILMLWGTPFFNQLTSSNLTEACFFNVGMSPILFGIPVFIIFISLLFAFLKIKKEVQPLALKPGKANLTSKFNIPAFHVAQLAISVLLIIGSIIVTKQINFITNKDIGLNKNVLEVRVPTQHKNVSPIFKAELEKQPSVEMISLSNASPVLEHYLLLLHYEENGVDKQYSLAGFPGDDKYTEALGIETIEGIGFSENAESNENKCIINESLAALFPDQNLIGKLVPGSETDRVIGICKDFHYGSLKQVIEPAYIPYSNQGFYLMVKPAPGQTAQARKAIAETWNSIITDFPLNVESIGDRYTWMHRENENYAKLIGACCFISVFLSMIGLFAVSYQTSQRRIKEIGIRKVNGAKISEILALLNKDIVIWIVAAFVVAMPTGWYFMHKWLENFAYKTELSWWVFALAGLLALGIALLTVSFQSWKTATRNPIDSLRYE